MDFNYLYYRQQVSLMLAARAACGPSRAAHQGLARLYSGAIEAQKAAGLSAPRHDGRGGIAAGTVLA